MENYVVTAFRRNDDPDTPLLVYVFKREDYERIRTAASGIPVPNVEVVKVNAVMFELPERLFYRYSVIYTDDYDSVEEALEDMLPHEVAEVLIPRIDDLSLPVVEEVELDGILLSNMPFDMFSDFYVSREGTFGIVFSDVDGMIFVPLGRTGNVEEAEAI